LLNSPATPDAETSAPATYYVDGPAGDGLAESGSDSNPGTFDAPWLTINHGDRKLVPGDTLYIRGGTYAEYIKDIIPTGTPDARVTVRNYKNETVIIRPEAGAVQDHVVSIRGDKSYITLRGLVLDGARKIRQHTLVIYPLEGKTPHHIRVENSTIMNGRSSGILSSAGDSEFVNLKVHRNGSDRRDHGIYIGTDNNVIDGCEFSHNRGFGIHIYTQAPESADNNVIRNCYSHHNGIAGAIIGVGTGNVAYNNILANNDIGIVVRGTNTRIYNNTIYGNKTGMDISKTTNSQITNNIIYQSSAITGRVKRGGAPTNTGLVLSNNLTDADPLFVDTVAGNFRLKAGSPAIDAGIALKEVLTDRDATPRPQGMAYDIGAYEFNSMAAATYVVATNGNDSNPGTEAQPWKTLSKASASIRPGDTVRIRGGEYFVGPTWRISRAGTAESPITYRAFGNGEVRISGSSLLPPGEWTHVKGAIYSSPINQQVLAVFRNAYPLHNPGERAKIFSVDDMIPNSFYVFGSTLYVWLEDGSDPRNSTIRAAPGHVISLYDCHHTAFDGLTVEYGFNGIKNQGKTTHDIVIRNCVIRSISSQGIQPVAANCIIENNLFQKIGSNKFEHGIYGSQPGTIIRHNVFEEIAGAGIHQYRQGEPPAGGNCEFNGNVFRKPRRMTVRSSPSGGSYYVDIIAWGQGGNRIYNNVFYGEGKRGGISLNSSDNGIYNNTFVGSTYAVGFYKGKTGNRVLNNIVQDATVSFFVWPANSLPQTVDYNLYHSATGAARWERDGLAYQAFAAYQQASGETHSLCTEAKLADPTDAHLQLGSPAIDAGVALKEVPTDFDGVARPQGAAYDLGAFEYRSIR
jgi:hypothetical protein